MKEAPVLSPPYCTDMSCTFESEHEERYLESCKGEWESQYKAFCL